MVLRLVEDEEVPKKKGGRPKKVTKEDEGFSISGKFAEIVTGPHNQSTSLLIVGRTGAGKSSAALRIAYDTAVKIAEIVGGTWEDYFTLDNVAIISNEEIYEVIQRMDKKHNVFILDDIGVGINSRKWQSKTNILMNDILQTMRTTNTVVIMTVPMSSMLDKVARSLPHYYMEMEVALFKKGISIAKFFEVSHKQRQGKIFHMYPTAKYTKSKIVRISFKRPPDVVAVAYEKKRLEIAEILRDSKMNEFKQMMDEFNGEVGEKPEKVSKSSRMIEIKRDVNAGVYADLREGLQANGFTAPSDLSYARNVISSYNGIL